MIDLNVEKKCVGITRKGEGCKNLGIYKSPNVRSGMFCRHHVPKHADKCVICLTELYDDMMLPCKHTFHNRCIQKWMKRHNSCPICRESIFTNLSGESFSNILSAYEGERLQIVIDIALLSDSVENFAHLTEELCI
jgi:hypothetical protein